MDRKEGTYYGKKRWIPGRYAWKHEQPDEAGAENAASDGRDTEGNGRKGV